MAAYQPKTPKSVVPGMARLQPLKSFKVRRPNGTATSPCNTVLSSVLSCWASSNYSITGCQAVEKELRMCMDAKQMGVTKNTHVNQQMNRLYPKLIGPHKPTR